MSCFFKPRKTSLKKATEKYDHEKLTLHDHVKKSMEKVDAPRALSSEVEGRSAKMINELAEWGYPIGKTEISLMVKNILDKSKIMETRFKNNIPGDDWVNAFAKRNKLSKRAASIIKRSRAAVEESITNSFIDNLEKVFEKIGMPFLQNKNGVEINFAVVTTVAF